MGMISEVEKAYMAGLIDGEGSIGIGRRTDGRKFLELRVCMSSEEPINTMRGIFGGNIYKSSRKRSPLLEQSGVGDDYKTIIYVWQFHHHQAAEVLQLVEPYLILKKEHARLGIDFVSYMVETSMPGSRSIPDEILGIREEFYQAMKELNGNRKYVIKPRKGG